jgi:hypothetical protein
MGLPGISSTHPSDLGNLSDLPPSTTPSLPSPSGTSFDSMMKQGIQGLFAPSGDDEEENEDEA